MKHLTTFCFEAKTITKQLPKDCFPKDIQTSPLLKHAGILSESEAQEMLLAIKFNKN